jgi:hypothetical protein
VPSIVEGHEARYPLCAHSIHLNTRPLGLNVYGAENGPHLGHHRSKEFQVASQQECFRGVAPSQPLSNLMQANPNLATKLSFFLYNKHEPPILCPTSGQTPASSQGGFHRRINVALSGAGSILQAEMEEEVSLRSGLRGRVPPGVPVVIRVGSFPRPDRLVHRLSPGRKRLYIRSRLLCQPVVVLPLGVPLVVRVAACPYPTNFSPWQ